MSIDLPTTPAPPEGTPMKRPDITPAQIAAVIQAIIAVAISFGVDISQAQSAALLGLSSIIGAGLLYGDARIREGRSRIEAAKQAAAVIQVQEPATVEAGNPPADEGLPSEPSPPS